MNHDVIIVGAGLAALSCAEHLLKQGLQVLILEKARRPGGRCASRRLTPAPDAPWFDFGAQYFTARDPEFQHQVLQWQERGWLDRWNPRLFSWDGRQDPQSSADEQTRWCGVGGMNRWLQRYCASLSGLDLRCEQRVIAVKRESNRWTVQTPSDSFRTRRLILGCPSQQARDLLPAELWPSGAPMLEPCLSLVCSTKHQLPFDALFSRHPNLAWAANNRSKPGATPGSQNLWTLHGRSDFSRQQIETDAPGGTGILLANFAQAAQLPAQAFTIVHQHAWRFAQMPAGDFARRNIWRPEEQLGLIGDYWQQGRVEGAWISGRLLARRLLMS